MTDKEKLEKIKALADKMYSRMAYLTSDTRPIRQAMDEYHQFIINEYHKEEPVSEELEQAAKNYSAENVSYWYDDEECVETYNDAEKLEQTFKAGANWQKAKDESTTEDLGEYINELSKQFQEVSFAKLSRIAVRAANWQKENLWKSANGDDLPEYDREVIVLINYNAQLNIHDEEYPTYRVGFGHRPNPNGWDGKSITTGNVEHYTPKTYDKGGWNAPDIVYWLDTKLPYEENKINKEIKL